MPFVTVTVSQDLSVEQKKQLLQESSDTIVKVLNAPLPSVRIILHVLPEGHYLNGGQWGTLAVEYVLDMIEGRPEQLKADLVKALGQAANRAIGIDENDVRVRMSDFPKTDMGVGGGLTAKLAGR